MDPIDYRRIRDTTDLPRGAIDASISLSGGYLGDYVDRLEALFAAYANQYPYSPGGGTTILSLRDHLQRVRAECGPSNPGVNLLYRTEELASDGTGGLAGWESAGCLENGGVCVGVEQLDSSLRPPAFDGERASAFRVSFGPFEQQACDSTSCAPACTATSCTCGVGCATTETTERRQTVVLNPGRYRISWYGRAVGAPSMVDPRNAISGSMRALAGSVFMGDVSSRMVSGDWYRYWRLVEVTGVIPATFVVGIAPRDSAGTIHRIGAVDVAGLMLENVSHAIEADIRARVAPPPVPPPYVGTRGESLGTRLRACEDTDGRVFRAEGWRRACERLCPDGFARGCELDETSEHCFWETEFTISQSVIEQSDVFSGGSFAIGNFNYRMEGVSLNLVGAGLRDCSTASTPSTCYATGVAPFSLTHVGPYQVRNHWGDTFDAPLFAARIEHGQALASERYLTAPLSSVDRALTDSVAHHEFRGRPLDGTYVLRLWEAEGLDLERLQDVQIRLDYYYWTRAR